MRLFEKDDLDRQLLDAGIVVIPLGFRARNASWNWIGAAWHLRSLIRTIRPNVVQTSLFTANLVGEIAGRLAGVPVVSTMTLTGDMALHTSLQPGAGSMRAWILRRIAAWTARHAADRFRALTEDARATNCASMRYPSERVEVIPRGVPTTGGETVAAPLDLPGGAGPVLVNVARHEAQKGHLFLIDAFQILRQTLPDAQLVIAGREGHATQAIRAHISDKDLGSHVHLMGSIEDVPALLARADIFVFSSLSEGLGTAVLEAMAAGVPVVAFDIPPVREITADGSVASLVPVGDVGTLADAMIETYGSDIAQMRALAAVQLVRREYTVDQVASRVLDLLQRVADQ